MRIAILSPDPTLLRFADQFKPEVDCDEIDTSAPRALKNFRKEEYTLALVDRRGVDPGNANDTTGEETAIHLARLGLPSILVLPELRGQDIIFERLRRRDVTGIIFRGAPLAEVAACLKGFRPGMAFPNCVASFLLKPPTRRGRAESVEELAGSAVWKEVGIHLKGRRLDPSEEQELAVLLRRLVSPSAKTVKLEKRSKGRSGGAILRAKVSPVSEDLAIKYGSRAQIQSEIMHYDRYVGPLPDGVAAHLRWRAETKHFGAIAYSWVGNSIEDGIPLGPRREPAFLMTWDRRRAAIDRLFSTSLSLWYKYYRNPEAQLESSVPILGQYRGEYGVWPAREGLNGRPLIIPPADFDLPLQVRQTDEEWQFHGFDKPVRLPNPLNWLKKEPCNWTISRLAPCHGDLHVGNVYVLPDNSPRLIDFGSTTLNHIFRDFAALETSIRLTCVADDDCRALAAAEDRVCDCDSLRCQIDWEGLGGTTPDLGEAVITTLHIRRAAREAAGYFDDEKMMMRDYLLAVVIHMLRYAAGEADEVPRADEAIGKATRVWHAMYGAAKAAERANRLAASARGPG